MHSAGQIRGRSRDLLLLEAGRDVRELARVHDGLNAGREAMLLAMPEGSATDRLFQIPATMTDGFVFPRTPQRPRDLPNLSLFHDRPPMQAPSAFDSTMRDESDPAVAMFEPNFADVAPVGEPLDQTRQIEEPVVAEKMELADNAALEIFLGDLGMSEQDFPYYNEKYLWLITQLQHFTERTTALTQQDREAFWQVLLNHLPFSDQAPQALEMGYGGEYANIFALLNLGVEVMATELHEPLVDELLGRGAKYPTQLRVLSADDFSAVSQTKPLQFELIVLNMPLPKTETAEELLDVIEAQTAPGGFAVISTDVPFMYLEHFWRHPDVWEPIMMDQEEHLSALSVLPSQRLRHGEGILAIFRRLP